MAHRPDLKQYFSEHIHLEPFIDQLPINLGFKISLSKTLIKTVIVDRGYFSSGIEDDLSHKELKKGLETISRLNVEFAEPFQIALIIAYEALSDITTSREDASSRALSLELCRLKHHIKVLSKIALNLPSKNLMQSIDELNISLWPLLSSMGIEMHRETILDILNKATFKLSELHQEYLSCVEAKNRLGNNAIINQYIAASYGLTGLFLRANKVYYDNRGMQNDRINYPSRPRICTAENADAWSRTFLRIEEIKASMEWLYNQVEQNNAIFIDPMAVFLKNNDQWLSPKKNIAEGVIEGPEGDIRINLFYNQTVDILNARISTPAFFIAQSLPYLLKNTDISNTSLILHSLGITASEVDF